MKHLRCWKYVSILSVAAALTTTLTGNIVHGQEAQASSVGSGFPSHSEKKIELGRMLFFDKILSGNRNISCASCHHPLNNTADGLSLGIGEGGKGLGPSRNLVAVSAASFDVKRRIPRNAPALFNLGHKEFRVMFHDGRVQKDSRQKSGFLTPAKDNTPMGLDSVLAAQALFPVTSGHEMAGEPGTNKVADAAAAKRFAGPDGVWGLLTERLRNIPEYFFMFQKAYPEIKAPSQINITHVANAIAGFESAAFRADNSPYDRFQNGEADCMSKDARDGLMLFLTKGTCARCHAGQFQTDQRFHSIAFPQIGPGKGDGSSGNHDYGREQVTKRETDRYKFRTPSLRNVALTAPYGHNGAYHDLRSMIKHHLNPAEALRSYNPIHTRMPNTTTVTGKDVALMKDPNVIQELVNTSEIGVIQLTDKEVDKIVEFLHCLTDPKSLNMLNEIPNRVPSGLPVYD